MNINVFQLDYVSYHCPDGYVFEGTLNVSVYAICHNWQWVQTFDSRAVCVRKSNLSLIHILFFSPFDCFGITTGTVS